MKRMLFVKNEKYDKMIDFLIDFMLIIFLNFQELLKLKRVAVNHKFLYQR